MANRPKSILGVFSRNLRKGVYRIPILITIFFLALSWLMPVFTPKQAEAYQQIVPRKLSIGTAQGSVQTTYTFSFTTVTSGFHLDGIKLIMCTTALGSYPGNTCTAPTNGGHLFDTGAYGSISGFTDTTAFTVDTTGANDCIPTGGHIEVLCLNRTSTTNDTAGAKTLVINTVTNPTAGSNSQTFFVGITTYNSNTYTVAGRKDAGTVASAIITSLQVTSTVAEILQFCIGASTVNDLTTDLTSSCSSAPGASSTVGLGTLDVTSVNSSPVALTPNGGTNTNGIAILRTNAQNGTNVYYDAVQASSGSGNLGAMRISGATCSGASTSDGCINSVGGTQTPLTAGVENFGFTIAGVSCVHEQTYSNPYACAYTSGTEHLVPQTNYIGQANTYGTSNGVAFVDTAGTNTLIAQCASNNSVADEALVMNFQATPTISTPFGSYSVNIDYTVVPNY